MIGATPLRPRAFTLVELLLVVFILAALAATAASLGTEVDQQSRYDDTNARRETIRLAILGDPARTANGQSVVGGFVADMGRLPRNLRELIEPPLDPALSWRPYAPAESLPGARDSLGAAPRGATQGAGWRGPYLRADLERDEAGLEFPTYRDGWKLSSGAGDPDFGWGLLLSSGPAGEALSLHSLGADNAPDLAPLGGEFSYAWDHPRTAAARRLVSPEDYRVSLGALVVKVRNASEAAIDLSQVAVLVMTPDLPELTTSPAAVDWSRGRQVSGALGGAGDALLPGETSQQRGPLALPGGAGPLTSLCWGQRSLVLVRFADPASDPPVLLGPVASVTLLPRTSPTEVTLELDAAP